MAYETVFGRGEAIAEKLRLKEQFDLNIRNLTQMGLIGALPDSRRRGIVGENWKEYPVPTIENLNARVASSQELIEEKSEQGFTKLILVPFGMPLPLLTERFNAFLNKKKSPEGRFTEGADGKLIDMSLSDESLRIVSDELLQPLIYFPERLQKEGHGGRTKQELLETDAWQMLFVKEARSPTDRRELKKGEWELEPKHSLEEYLAEMKKNNEQGMTPESWLILAAAELEEHGRLIDEVTNSIEVQGDTVILPGAMTFSADVPFGYSSSKYQVVYLGTQSAQSWDLGFSARSSVRI